MSKKDDKIAEAWRLMQKYPSPANKTKILDKLLNAKDFSVTMDDFEDYDVTMSLHAGIEKEDSIDTLNAEELQKRLESQKEKGAPEMFSQVDHMSDSRILAVFDSKYDLEGRITDIGDPPQEAKWYKDGKAAEQRILELRGTPGDPGYYETLKKEEWEELESPLPIGMDFLMGPIGFLTELVGAPLDLRYDFKEDLHERASFGSGHTGWTANPFTGFGLWDIAEFKKNPRTGQGGFSPELLGLEAELEEMYEKKRIYKERTAPYNDVLGLAEELKEVESIINTNKLIDPRLGETY